MFGLPRFLRRSPKHPTPSLRSWCDEQMASAARSTSVYSPELCILWSATRLGRIPTETKAMLAPQLVPVAAADLDSNGVAFEGVALLFFRAGLYFHGTGNRAARVWLSDALPRIAAPVQSSTNITDAETLIAQRLELYGEHARSDNIELAICDFHNLLANASSGSPHDYRQGQPPLVVDDAFLADARKHLVLAWLTAVDQPLVNELVRSFEHWSARA